MKTKKEIVEESQIYKDFCRVYLDGIVNHARLNEHGDIVSPCIRDAFAGWKACYEEFMKKGIKL